MCRRRGLWLEDSALTKLEAGWQSGCLPEAVGRGCSPLRSPIFLPPSSTQSRLSPPGATGFQPVPWHQSLQRRRSRNPLQAAAGETPEETELPQAPTKEGPSCTPSPPTGPSNPISPPLGRGRDGGSTHVAHFDPAVLLQQPLFDLRPQRVRHVEAGAG